jgi:hypothetical protein
MQQMVCAVYDRKIDSFGTQTFVLCQNDEIAKRAIHAAVLDADTEYSRYAGDFSLWHVGDFDLDTGVMVGIERRKVCEFDAFLVSKEA